MSDQPEREAMKAKIAGGLSALFEAALAMKTDGEFVYDDKLARTAIRIAANVYRPGVIEEAIGEHFGNLAPPASAAAIRAALTQDKTA